MDRALVAAAEEKALQSAIDGQDVQTVARLVVTGASTRIRQAAAAAIDDPEVLRQLIRDLRGGNDKNVYKLLTSKRDALLDRAREREQSRTQARAASIDLESHSHRSFDVLYGDRLEQLERSWSAVAAQADTEMRDRARQAIDRSRENIAGHLRLAAAKAADEQAAADAAAEAIRLREQQARAAAIAAAEQARVFESQGNALAERQEAETRFVRQMAELIRKARIALSDGSTARAAGVRRAIEEKLTEALPLPAKLVGQIQQLDKQLEELKDWKSFSVTPKRAELIEEMASLVGMTSDPLALAERIKSLQEQWRTLSKGAGENAEADWQRFQETTRRAYQPCREYFAAQALVREENRQRRDALIARLTAFEAGQDWEQADWQSVIRTLRETRQEWRRCSPVDREAGKPQQEEFVALAASLQARLDDEYVRNSEQKESLIERARQLLASDDGRKAIDAIKELQKQWQAVGPVPREVDQRLWSDFRQLADAVFQKRQQDLNAYTAGLENNRAQAIVLCERLEAIAAVDGVEPRASAGMLGELRTAFAALGEFPRADSRELHNRFDQGLARFEDSIARQDARDAERAWDDLFTAADHVRAYRLAVSRQLDDEQVADLRNAAESHLASVQQWPEGGLDAVRQALADERFVDVVANEAALRLLCIRAEILTETPTPLEDQPLRREYKLRDLVQGMGQRLTVEGTRLDSLAIEWVRVGPVDETMYETLLRRFRFCRERKRAGSDSNRAQIVVGIQ